MEFERYRYYRKGPWLVLAAVAAIVWAFVTLVSAAMWVVALEL